jgi:hypothetical protein
MKRAWFLLLSVLGLLLSVLSPVCMAQSLKPGTEIKVRLLDRLNTGETQAGQTFSATIAVPVRSGGRTIFVKNAKVSGQVIEVVSSGRLKRPASISLELTQVGRTAVHTEVLQIDGKSHAKRDTALIGGGAAVGAVLGAIAGGGKGAAIGTVVGAGAGTGTAYATGKQEIVLPAETELTFAVAGNSSAESEKPIPNARESETPAPSASPDSSNWRREPSYAEQDDDDSLMFSRRDQRIIRAYFDSDREDLPPGLAKRGGNLPPGLEKHIRRDGTLPPGLQRRVRPFPERLDRRLGPLPEGYSRAILSDRAMILASNGRIVDIMFIYQ